MFKVLPNALSSVLAIFWKDSPQFLVAIHFMDATVSKDCITFQGKSTSNAFHLLTCTHTDRMLCINDVILQHYWQSGWTDAVLAEQRLWENWCTGIVSYSFLSLTPNYWPSYSSGLAVTSLHRRNSSRGTITYNLIYLSIYLPSLSKRTRSDAELCCKDSYWGR